MVPAVGLFQAIDVFWRRSGDFCLLFREELLAPKERKAFDSAPPISQTVAYRFALGDGEYPSLADSQQ